MTTSSNWIIHQIDINNVFMHMFLHDDIFIFPLKGYTSVKHGEVCKLVESLYRLKKASREWNHEFCKALFSQ